MLNPQLPPRCRQGPASRSARTDGRQRSTLGALPRALVTALLVVFICSHGAVFASGGANEAVPTSADEPAITNVKGYVSASYHYSSIVNANVSYGGADGVLDGVTFGVGLSFDWADFAVDLSADHLSFARQQFTVGVRGHGYTGRLSVANIPPATAADGRRTDVSLQNNLRLEGLPDLGFGLAYKADAGSTSLSLNTSISDSYRDLTEDLTGLRWHVGYRVSSRERAGRPGHTAHDASLRLDLDVTEQRRPEVSFKPGVSAQFRWDGDAVDPRFRQTYGLSLDARTEGGHDQLGLKFDFEHQPGAHDRTRQSVRYSTQELAPVTLNAQLTADQRGPSRQADYHLGVGFDLAPFLTLDAGYHGRSGTAGSSNGVEATFGARYAVRPWYLSANVSGDLQFSAAGTDPSARLSVNLRYQGDPLTASLTTNLTYRAGWRGRVELSSAYTAASWGLNASAGAQLANDLSTNLSLAGHVSLGGAWALQGGTDYRARFGTTTDSVLTLSLGVRYDFGGQR